MYDYDALYQQQLYNYERDRQLNNMVNWVQLFVAVLTGIAVLYSFSKK